MDYFNGVLKINLKNNLTGGHSITKIVFPMIDTGLYYKDTKAIFDTVTGVLRKKITLELFDVEPETIQTDWAKSPSYERIEVAKRLEMGVD